MPARCILVPPDLRLQSDTDLESSDDELSMHGKQTRVFVSALTRMTRLDAFVWSCGHPLVSLHDVWPTLLRWCATLRNFQINDASIFNVKPSDASEDDTRKRQQAAKRKLTVRRSIIYLSNSFLNGIYIQATPLVISVSSVAQEGLWSRQEARTDGRRRDASQLSQS